MAEQKVGVVHNALNGGEVSPRLEVRKDLKEKYLSSVKTLENFIPMSLGGIKRRVGWRFVGRSKNSGLANDTVRMIRFRYSSETVYMFEFGHTYFRVYQAGERIASVDVTTPYDEDDLAALSFFQSADVLYLCHKLYYTRKILRTAVDTFVIQVVQWSPPALTEHEPSGSELGGSGGGGGVPAEDEVTPPPDPIDGNG